MLITKIERVESSLKIVEVLCPIVLILKFSKSRGKVKVIIGFYYDICTEKCSKLLKSKYRRINHPIISLRNIIRLSIEHASNNARYHRWFLT